MFWDIFWGLSLGFLFSAIIEEIVSKDEMSRLLPDSGPRSIAIASGLGAASSSCSYAAVAMARSMVRKGADFTAAMAFQFAATNLVLELGLLLVVLLGWQFGVAEFIGGPIMIILLVLIFRWTLKPPQTEAAIIQAKRNVQGSMEGHAQMAMGKHEGNWRDRLGSRQGWIAISHGFVMNWAMLWKDILVGVLVAGALGAWVPDGVWQSLFFAGHPLAASIWGAFLGPLIAIASFTCSVGNVPFASVLWKGGISFGGVIAFIFGDLIIPPILNIYRKYYGGRMSVYLLATFYLVMVAAALMVEGLFALLHLLPQGPRHGLTEGGISLNYTTVLNILFGALALGLYVAYARTGGPQMMREMEGGHCAHHRR
ncbi:MAG TPA: permease [Steroidobacteraceae bacterium]